MSTKYVFTLAILLTITACAPARFDFNKAGDGGNLTASSVSTPDIPDPAPGPTPIPTPDPVPNPNPNPNPHPTPDPNPTPGPTPDPTPCPGHEHHDPPPADPGLYLCILNGPGKNTRIGYVDHELTSANGAPTDVCMSQNACLNIASKAFPVSGDFSHPCKGLLHNVAIQMTDEQVQTLIDKLLKP